MVGNDFCARNIIYAVPVQICNIKLVGLNIRHHLQLQSESALSLYAVALHYEVYCQTLCYCSVDDINLWTNFVKKH